MLGVGLLNTIVMNWVNEHYSEAIACSISYYTFHYWCTTMAIALDDKRKESLISFVDFSQGFNNCLRSQKSDHLYMMAGPWEHEESIDSVSGKRKMVERSHVLLHTWLQAFTWFPCSSKYLSHHVTFIILHYVPRSIIQGYASTTVDSRAHLLLLLQYYCMRMAKL